MSDDSFLINAFDGHLGIDRLRVFRNIEPDDKTRQLTRQFHEIQEEYPAAYLDAEGVIPPEAMDRLKQIGFFGLNIPVEYGGSGLDLWQYLQVVEEIISRNMSLGFTALAHLSIGIKGILLYGTDAQKKKYLPLAASGAMIFSYALTEPDRGSDAQHIQTTATLSADGRHYILNGRKTYITNANYADGLTVFAQMDSNKPGFMGAFVVETGWKGVKIGKDMPKMGLKASSTAAIQFKNVEVPVENLLGRPGDGFKIAMTILNYGRLALGAGSTGMMRQSLADMKKRAATRTQFDIPINRFELIQEMLVRARVNGYIASAITAFTASMLPADPLAVVAIESSHTKLFGTTRAWLTLYDALQVAGGAGYLATLPYELRMRDFRVATIFEGTTEIH
ncbi:MAG: acyl-CoA dehydrogenase family protein, partial [Desulfobacterales bacterium]